MNVSDVFRFSNCLCFSKMAKKTFKMMFARFAILHQQRRKFSIFMELSIFTIFLNIKLSINFEAIVQLKKGVKKCEEKLPKLWNNKIQMLHQEITLTHIALSVKTFLVKCNITVLEQSYSYFFG